MWLAKILAWALKCWSLVGADWRFCWFFMGYSSTLHSSSAHKQGELGTGACLWIHWVLESMK